MRILTRYHNAEHVCSAPQTELSLTPFQLEENHFVMKQSVAHHTFNYNMSRNYSLCMSFIVFCHTAPSPRWCLRVLFGCHLLTFSSAKRFGRRCVNRTGVAPLWLQSGLTSAATVPQQEAPFQHTAGWKCFFFFCKMQFYANPFQQGETKMPVSLLKI